MLEASRLKAPGLQGTHVGEPARAAAVPAAQGEQVALPAAELLPGGHGAHASAHPAADEQKLPAGHGAHEREPAREK